MSTRQVPAGTMDGLRVRLNPAAKRVLVARIRRYGRRRRRSLVFWALLTGALTERDVRAIR